MKPGLEKVTYHRYNTREERLASWQFNREAYQEWRFGAECQRWIKTRKRKQSNLCFICMTPLFGVLHIDHIFPLYLGGTNAFNNMCLTHAACNMDKGIKVTTYDESLKRRRQFNKMLKAANKAKRKSATRNKAARKLNKLNARI